MNRLFCVLLAFAMLTAMHTNQAVAAATCTVPPLGVTNVPHPEAQSCASVHTLGISFDPSYASFTAANSNGYGAVQIGTSFLNILSLCVTISQARTLFRAHLLSCQTLP